MIVHAHHVLETHPTLDLFFRDGSGYVETNRNNTEHVLFLANHPSVKQKYFSPTLFLAKAIA